jgi:hypothetical protein
MCRFLFHLPGGIVRAVFRSLAVSAITCGSIAAFQVQAAPVGPGQTVPYSAVGDSTYTPPGTVIAQQTLSKTFTYDPQFNPDPGAPFNQQHPELTFSFTNKVYRADDGHLTFTFEPVGSDTGFGERWSITTGDYSGFTTDVHSFDASTLSRDNAGNVTLARPDSSGHGIPSVLIETNATNFNQQGTADVTGADEFMLDTGPSSSTLVLSTTAGSLSGLYQPASEGGPAAIPLPPAVYGGLAMLAGIVVTRVRRPRTA